MFIHKNLEACSGSSTTSMYFDLFLELHLNPQGMPKQHIFDIKKSVPEDRQLQSLASSVLQCSST